MGDCSTKRRSGFSLLEMVIAMALGNNCAGRGGALYSQGVPRLGQFRSGRDAAGFRAASDMLMRDLSLAGAGLENNVQIGLPTTSTTPVYGCDQSLKCYISGNARHIPSKGPRLIFTG